MAFDPIKALADAGNPVEHLTDAQKAAFSTLTEHEVEVLTSIQGRLNPAGEDVEGMCDVNIFRVG